MKRLLFTLLLFPLTLQAQHVESTWESINRRGRNTTTGSEPCDYYPQWFSDAKLGIFVHWGLYSVPAYAGKEGYAEWFYRGLMVKDSGRCRIMSLYADTTLPVFEQYKTLADHWHAELWQPQEWARMFREAGARYVVLVTKHHDGYSLWDDPCQPRWNSVASGPRRNIVEELTEAVRAEGLKMGFYYSLPEWSNPRHIWMQDPDTAIGDYVDNYMVPQFKDLISRYRPSLIFADGDWQNSATDFRSAELIAWYYNLVGPDAIVNDRWGSGTQHGFRTPEYSAGISVADRPWAECRGIGRSFGLNRNEDLNNHLTATELIQHFCELVAHGGGLTLNVGPAADGTIPLIQQERLQALGKWLEVNGEAIYESRPYMTPGGVMSPCQRTRTVAMLPESSTIDFDWVRNAPLKGMPVDNFEIQWEGITGPTPPGAGDYIIRIEGDDEVWLPLGSDTLYYNRAWAENNNQATVHLDGNSVLYLNVRYREKDLEATVHVTWSRDGGRTFTPIYADWHGKATWERTLRCFTAKGNNLYVIEFERPGQTLTLPDIPRLPKGTAITLLGTTGTIKWKQKNDGTLTLDLSTLDTKELNALDHAWVLRIQQ